MNTSRPLEMAVKAAHAMMDGNPGLAHSKAMGAIHDAETAGGCNHMAAAKKCLDGFHDDEPIHQRMAIIQILVAAARDHSPREDGVLY